MRVERICKQCGNTYYIDKNDNIDLCHECYLGKYSSPTHKFNELQEQIKSCQLYKDSCKNLAIQTLEVLANYDDTEHAHVLADEVLLALVGDEEIKEAYNKVQKWYS